MGINVVLKKMVLGAGLLAGYSFAAPANPMPFTVDNQGDSVTLQRAGDEHYSFTRTSDGFLVLRQDDGVYYYADENGAATKFKAKNAEHRSDKEKAFLNKLNKDASFKSHRKNTPERFKRPAGKAQRAPWVPTGDTSSSATGASAGNSTTGISATSASSSDSDAHPVLRLPSAEKHANGTNRFPILLVQGVGATNMDSTKASNIFNQEGYSSGGYLGSVRDYFVDQSNGRFVPTFDVYMVSVSKSAASYKGSEYSFVTEALAALKSKYPSFNATPYDADGNGEVDAVGLIYAGSDEQGNHMGGYQYKLEYEGSRADAGNGKKFNNYFIISQQTYMFVALIHEFSHTMGLHDHYCVYGNDCYKDFSNSQYQAPGAHAWDVMGTGMYNGSGLKPPNYSAFERNFMGWLNYTNLSASSSVTSIGSIDKFNMAYKIPVSGNDNEWFILENRQANKWDSGLPNHGMLVWHIDFDQTAWFNDALNDDPAHQRVDVVEAGNLKVTEYQAGQRATYLKDDSFPGSQNVTSYGPFKAWNGTSLNISLYSITEKNNLVCFATQSGVAVSDCIVPSSSSTAAVAQSSSSVASSSSATGIWSIFDQYTSSSMAGSSAAVASSSSVTSAIPVAVYKSQVQLQMRGSYLEIATEATGPKKVELFDMLGNKLYATDFFGARHSVDLAPFAGKVLVARVMENGRLLKQSRVAVR